MHVFRSTVDEDVTRWVPEPDSPSAHAFLLDWLQKTLGLRFLTGPISNAVKGNLGESITLCIGVELEVFPGHHPHPVNGHDPFFATSRPGIDLVWVRYGTQSRDDRAILQEVKTTSDLGCQLAEDLLADYEKLFGTDIELTLTTRLQAMANLLRLDGDSDRAERLIELTGISPATCDRVEIVPTLVHDIASSRAKSRLLNVRRKLMELGWHMDRIMVWAVGLDNLGSRLQRLAEGKA